MRQTERGIVLRRCLEQGSRSQKAQGKRQKAQDGLRLAFKERKRQAKRTFATH